MAIIKPLIQLATWPIRAAVSTTAGVTRAIAHTKIGGVLLAGAALLGAGLGLKAISDHHDKEKHQEMMAMAPEAGALREHIVANRQRLAQTSAELGQYNNANPNFREAVRGNGIAQSQPDI